MSILHIVLVILTGIAAGFLNVNAGGGSLIVMPMLIFLGLPSAVANGTNRIALMVQNIIAISNFRSKGFFDWKLNITLALPAVVGSLIGSNLAISMPAELFNKILAVVMLIVLALIIWNPQSKLKTKKESLKKKDKIIGAIIFFFIGIYGGAIQAGVGFIIIAALTLITGFSLVRINSMKVFIVAIYMALSLLIFIINGKVNWLYGLSLSVGNGVGAYIGSNFSVKKGDKWVKVILVVAIILMSAKLFGVFKLF
jgi:uncharacterized membrane protein YfcA